MRYEPLSRSILSATLLKVPSQLSIRPTDILDRLDNNGDRYKIIGLGGHLDGKEPVATLLMNSGRKINVAVLHDKMHGIMKIECYFAQKTGKSNHPFWESQTASRVEAIVKSIAEHVAYLCRNQGLSNEQQGSSFIFFHKVDQHYDNIRTYPDMSLANHCKRWHHRDILSGAAVP